MKHTAKFVIIALLLVPLVVVFVWGALVDGARQLWRETE